MSYTKQEIDIVFDTWIHIEKKYNLVPTEKGRDEIANGHPIQLRLPEEDDYFEIHTDLILEYQEDFQSEITFSHQGVSRTNRISEHIVRSDNSPITYFSPTFDFNGIQVALTTFPLITPLVAVRENAYGEYAGPARHDVAIILYEKGVEKLSIEEEIKLLESYFFELANRFDVGIEFGYLHDHIEDFEKLLEDNFESFPKSPPEFNEAMKYFNDAHIQESEDLRFLSFYKVIELLSPVYAKSEAFNRLSIKLTSANADYNNADFLQSIFDLSKKYQFSLKDRNLIKVVMDKTFILEDAFNYAPNYLKKKLKLDLINSYTKPEIIINVINALSSTIYDTRNSIVHAKANYKETGFECPSDELEELNKFMKFITHSTIMWYNRLPPSIKLDVSKGISPDEVL